MAITIAFSNHKGGVGKTTSAINIGTDLQKQGFSVLLVDFDPQANLSSLGVRNPTESIYDAISKKIPALPIVTNAEGLHIVPSHIDLSGAEMETVQVPGRDNILKRHLKPLLDTFDFILMDFLFLHCKRSNGRKWGDYTGRSWLPRCARTGKVLAND